MNFHNESSELVKIIQDDDLNDKNLAILDDVSINRKPNQDKQISNKTYVDDSIGGDKIVRFNQTLDNYLKLSVGNDVYNLMKFDKVQITDTTIIKYRNSGGYFLQHWFIKSNDKNNNAKLQNFIRSTKTNSPTDNSGATSSPPFGNSFMCIEPRSGNSASGNVL